ncbi:MAG: hypothetical protein J6B53_08145 [Clostridia bacterium]|nr:hypothetical protein [Clostridia bacterium]
MTTGNRCSALFFGFCLHLFATQNCFKTAVRIVDDAGKMMDQELKTMPENLWHTADMLHADTYMAANSVTYQL